MKNLLFQPIKINQMKVKNRIYMPAMHLAMCEDFKITDQIVQFYARRAKGGAGLICVGYATIDDMSGNSQNIGAHKDEYLEGLAALAKGIKDNGAKAAIQLNHAGRYNFSFFMDGRQPVAPSPSNASNAGCISPVEIPFKYNQGINSSKFRVRFKYGGTN